MKKQLFILLIFCTCLNAFARQERTLFYGATTSLDFGRFQDHVEMTPLMGIKILPRIYAGIGATLAYYSKENAIYQDQTESYSSTEIKDKVWYKGGEVFLRFVPFDQKEIFLKNIYIQTSYEALWGKGEYYDSSGTYKYNTDNFTPFVGMGYKQPLLDQFSLGIMLAFKLNKEADSPYRNSIVRITFEF